MIANRTIQNFFEGNPVPLTDAVLWQYNSAHAINTLINTKSNWYVAWDEEFWIQWVENVFNLITANAFGLCVWSIILNLPLFINTPLPNITDIWGFNAYDPYPDLENSYTNFSGGNFSNIGSSLVLTVEQQRFALRLKYLKLISRGSVPQTNYNLHWLMLSSLQKGLFLGSPVANPTVLTGTLTNTSTTITGLSSTIGLAELMTITGTGIPANTVVDTILSATSIVISNAATVSGAESLSFGFPTAWVLEDFNMQLTYQFNFYLPTVLQQVITKYRLLPNPAGVFLNYQYWDGSAYVNF